MFKLKDYTDKTDFSEIKLTQRQAIMAKCYDCCCYDRNEVKLCESKTCPLYQYKKAYFNKEKSIRNYTISDEQREWRRNNMKEIMNRKEK